MKKIYTLTLLLALGLSANSQNLVTNGDLEVWTDPSTPGSFSPAPFTAAATQESTIKHGGAFSAKHTTAATSSVRFQNETAVITPGATYTISYWFLDNDPLARSRPWTFWLDAGNATITDAASDAILRPATYSTDNAAWVQFTGTFVAPANAVKLRFEMRTYAQGAGLGSVYYDDLSVVEVPLSVNENNISGLKVYPNPAKTVLNVTSNSFEVKQVELYDVLGKLVLSTKVTNAPLNVSALSKGVYVVKVTEAGKSDTRKIVIE